MGRDQFEHLLVDWLDDTAGQVVPAYLEEAMHRIEHVDQRSAWLNPGSWLPISASFSGRYRLPALAPSVVALILMLIIAFAIALGVGSRFTSPRPLPPPFGLAAPGLIAYDSDGDIMVSAPDGMGIRTLVRAEGSAFGATWSRSGTRLAYWLRPDSKKQRAELWVLGSDGRDSRRLSGDLELTAFTFDQNISWSPDGRTLAFGSADQEIYVVGADGSGLLRLGQPGLGRAHPAWSPSGEWIAFSGRSTPGCFGDRTCGVYVIRPDGSEEQKVSQATGGSTAFLLPSWAPDGGALLYHAGTIGGGDVMIARQGPGAWTEEVLIGGETDDAFPAWSNSGALVAFMRGQPPSARASILIVDVAGGQPVPLADVVIGMGGPLCFAPDDETILAVSAPTRGLVEQQANPLLLVIPVAGGPPIEIPAPGLVTFSGCAWQRLSP